MPLAPLATTLHLHTISQPLRKTIKYITLNPKVMPKLIQERITDKWTNLK
jgi:hypothetical protein